MSTDLHWGYQQVASRNRNNPVNEKHILNNLLGLYTQEFPHFSCLGILIGFIAYTYKYTFQDVGTE